MVELLVHMLRSLCDLLMMSEATTNTALCFSHMFALNLNETIQSNNYKVWKIRSITQRNHLRVFGVPLCSRTTKSLLKAIVVADESNF